MLVLLVCYSHGLASYLERITATWNRRQQPAYVGEFHDLGKKWGAPEGPDESLRTEETVQFWEHDLPMQMADLATQLEPGHRFDAIVVDEAQDFADAWWDPLLAALETGGQVRGLFAYGHVLGFKGLERRAVVLVVMEESAFERSRERLYVGLSRARDQLVVCGDPDFLREVGGPDLARRLTIPEA